MDKNTPADTQKTEREQHSLPGTNMAGKGPGNECEPRDKRDSSRPDGGQAPQPADDQDGGDTPS